INSSVSPSTHTGAFVVAGGGGLTFAGGTQTFNSPASFVSSGGGRVSLTGGTMGLNTPPTGPNFTLTGGPVPRGAPLTPRRRRGDGVGGRGDVERGGPSRNRNDAPSRRHGIDHHGNRYENSLTADAQRRRHGQPSRRPARPGHRRRHDHRHPAARHL